MALARRAYIVGKPPTWPFHRRHLEVLIVPRVEILESGPSSLVALLCLILLQGSKLMQLVMYDVE